MCVETRCAVIPGSPHYSLLLRPGLHGLHLQFGNQKHRGNSPLTTADLLNVVLLWTVSAAFCALFFQAYSGQTGSCSQLRIIFSFYASTVVAALDAVGRVSDSIIAKLLPYIQKVIRCQRCTVLPHSRKVVGSIPRPAALPCRVIACSPCVYLGSCQLLCLPLTVQRHAQKANWKLKVVPNNLPFCMALR